MVASRQGGGGGANMQKVNFFLKKNKNPPVKFKEKCNFFLGYDTLFIQGMMPDLTIYRPKTTW
jgi:hypothetical protein